MFVFGQSTWRHAGTSESEWMLIRHRGHFQHWVLKPLCLLMCGLVWSHRDTSTTPLIQSRGLGSSWGEGTWHLLFGGFFTPDNMIKPWICIHAFKGLHLLGVVGPNIDASRVRKDLISMINKPNAYCGLIKYPTKLYTCKVCLHWWHNMSPLTFHITMRS